MKLSAVLYFLFIGFATQAQTKEIAFKSHSGNMKNYSISLGHNIFSDGSNFGLPSHRNYTKLDSVIYISAVRTVIVESIYSSDWMHPIDSATFSYFRRDTVKNHPLYAQKHSLDSIKKVLENNRTFSNKIEEVVFVGYDNKKPKIKKPAENKIKETATEKKEQNILPVISNENNNTGNPTTPTEYKNWFIACIALFVLAFSYISWRLHQHSFLKA